MSKAVRREFFIKLTFRIMKSESLCVFCSNVIYHISADPATLRTHKESYRFYLVIVSPFNPLFKDLPAFIIKKYYTVAAFCVRFQDSIVF
jgi:hypothetical protein